MALCKACGREIAGDMMFCPYCGTKRTLDVTGRPVEDVPESRIGVIPFVSGEGQLAGNWTIIVGDRRLVFARAGPDDETSQRRPGSVGLGLMTRRGPDSGCGLTYAQRYQEMTVEEAYLESKSNIDMPISDIQLARISQDEDDRYSIRMSTSKGELVFTFPLQHDHREYLRTVLGTKLVW